MFNMRHSSVLLDISKLIKLLPESLEMIEENGIKVFLDTCKENDKLAIEELNQEYATQLDVDDYNYTFHTNYTRAELISYLKQFYLVLPHADYKYLDEIKDILQQIHYDNPNIFQELVERPYADIHNELMQKYNPPRPEDNI